MVRAGDRLFLQCSTNVDTFIGWSRLTGNGDQTRKVESGDRINITRHGLLIEPAVVSDSGVYFCHVINTEGSREHRVSVLVHSPPNLLPPFLEARIVVANYFGGSSAFGCLAEGNPLPDLTWWKNGVQIRNSKKMNIFETNTTYKAGTSLRIRHAVADDIASYQCRATNEIGETVRTIQFELERSTPPLITLPPKNIRLPIESTVYIRCKATGRPAPGIKWTKNGRKFKILDRFTQTEDYLKIEQVQVADSGHYGCHAFNLGGKTARRMTLTVWDPRVERETARNEPTAAARQAVQLATIRVMTSVNETINRLQEHRTSDHVPIRNLFALAKFPPLPSRAMAVAAEVFEEAVRIAQDNIAQIDPLSDRQLSNTANILTREEIELLRTLAGCDDHRPVPDCDTKFCFHKQFRSPDG